MSAPQILVVDDSEAVLAYAKAALSGAYSVITAADGLEALERLAQSVPAAVLLDLSMPRLSGDEVLARMQAHEEWRDVPVVIISSEAERARELLSRGAALYLPKPLNASSLAPEIGKVLEQAQRKKAARGLAVIPIRVGDRRIALPLDQVEAVVQQPATQRLLDRGGVAREVFELYGRLVLVVDLCRPLGVTHREKPVDRAMLVIKHDGLLLGLSVDRVEDPSEVPAAQVVRRENLAGKDPLLLQRMVQAVVREEKGSLVVLDPGVLFNSRLIRRLHTALDGLEARAS